ncbi:outer membrane protein assembly factor BamE [Hydrogenophaga sp.]|uniref:outer membrane protein assembly factor BamE domain-containing protein n=1 Tax=Hydrogenophaga sp. TaxID=1904254 RepID=UPI002726DCBC|nr:outer membrane protein assembly factor BamE [Hydrogenophaga sp.]MDO8904106.1 outer membrane protein assembly factor BamE [Hydrogenophaga sp.]
MNFRTAFPTVLGLCMALPGSFTHAQVPEQGFLCCNMRTDGSWISDINYEESGKRIVPYGTPLTFKGFGRNRVEVEMEGKRQWLGNDYSRDLSKEAFAQRYIVATDPRTVVAKAGPKVRQAIETARVTPGMTREQVAMAVGYPVSSENPNLDAPRWRYWLWSYSPFTVIFNEQGRVASVETDADTMLKVFLK